MRQVSSANAAAVIGCVDARATSFRKLAHWCAAQGARRLCEAGPFRLWALGPDTAGIHPVKTNGLDGILMGDIYLPTDTPLAQEGSIARHLAHAFTDSGPQGLFRLNGQFGVFLWDSEHREAILFRDCSAGQSLYFSRCGERGLVFSSNLDLLVSSPLVERRLSRRSIHEFLRFLDISPPNTIYDGVSSAEPGVLYRKGRTLTREEPPAHPGPDEMPETLTEASIALESRLQRAIEVRKDQKGTTLAFLSGGVDSSLICALASRCSGPVEAITVGFEETEFDESQVARRVANHLGIPHQVLAFPMLTYREAFDEITSLIQYPSADPAGLPTLLAFQTACGVGTVAMDGTGADTLFGVMPARHQRMAVEFGSLLPQPLRRLAAMGLKTLPGLSGYAPLVDFDDPEEVLIRWRGWSRDELDRLCGEPVSLAHTRFYQIFRQFPRHAHFDRYSALLGNLPDDRIHQAAGLTGLNVRFPYLDPAVTEWVDRLDLSLRYHPSEPKPVLKAVLARHIPRALWDLPKHGFDFPFLQLMTADDCALVRTYLDPALTERWDLFDQKQIQATQAALIGADRGSAFSAKSPAFRAWALVVLFAWLENHLRSL